MSIHFFPSCKVQQQFPQASLRLQDYLQKRWQLKPAGCCRVNHQQLASEDAAFYICNTCGHILTDSSAAKKVQAIWQLIDQDEQFPFPDYQGELMTVQDCWLASDKPEVQQVVRSLLYKMNIQPLELTDNFAQSRFCGVTTSAATYQLAPTLSDKAGQMSPEERQNHLRQINTDKVVCYCRPCYQEINASGKHGVHMLELLFPEQLRLAL